MKRLFNFQPSKNYQSIPTTDLADFFKACRTGNLNIVKNYIEEQKGDINIQEKKTYHTGLTIAAEERQLEIVKYLVQRDIKLTLARRPTTDEDAWGGSISMNALACAVKSKEEENAEQLNIKHDIVKTLLNTKAEWKNIEILWDLIENDSITNRLIIVELVLLSAKKAACGKSFRKYYEEEKYLKRAEEQIEFLIARAKKMFPDIPAEHQQKFIILLNYFHLTHEQLGIEIKNPTKKPDFFPNTSANNNNNNNDDFVPLDEKTEQWLNEGP